MNKLRIIDPETGVVKEVPISEFMMHSYKETIIHGRENEIDVTSIIRQIHQKSRLKKKSDIKISVDGIEADIEIPALALKTLLMYSQDEISDLVTDPFLSKEFEKTYSVAIPNDLQPSTSKQRVFALNIAELLNIDLGYEILASKRKIGIFISEYQNEHGCFDSDLEGVEFISARLEDAIIKYFLKEECWVDLFNTAFELYLLASELGRKVIIQNLSRGISDSYWNKARDLPEGDVVCEVISEMSFKLRYKGTYAEKFMKIHKKQST